MYKHTYNIH